MTLRSAAAVARAAVVGTYIDFDRHQATSSANQVPLLKSLPQLIQSNNSFHRSLNPAVLLPPSCTIMRKFPPPSLHAYVGCTFRSEIAIAFAFKNSTSTPISYRHSPKHREIKRKQQNIIANTRKIISINQRTEINLKN